MAKKVDAIVFHYIQSDEYSVFPNLNYLSTNNFVKMLDYLQETGHTFVDDNDLLYADQYSKFPDKAVLLTFDDGLKCCFNTVFPILSERRIPAVFFPSARPILSRKAINATKLHYIFSSIRSNMDIIQFVSENFNIDLYKYVSSLGTDSRFDDKITTTIKRFLQREANFKLRAIIIDHLFREFVTTDEENFVDNIYMTASELNIMIDKYEPCLFSIGGHGYLHEWNDGLSNARIEKEIFYSDMMIRKVTEWGCLKTYSYPYGSYNETMKKVLKRRKYKFAFTIEPRTADLEKDDWLELPRWDCNDIMKRVEEYYK